MGDQVVAVVDVDDLEPRTVDEHLIGVGAGVLVGGSAVGGANSLLTVWISPVAAQIAVFIMAILVIRLRPEGILGGRK